MFRLTADDQAAMRTEMKRQNHDYFEDGVRLLELSKKAYFLFNKQKPEEKRSDNPLTFLPLRTPLGKNRRSPELAPATFVQSGSAQWTLFATSF